MPFELQSKEPVSSIVFLSGWIDYLDMKGLINLKNFGTSMVPREVEKKFCIKICERGGLL